MNYLTKQGAFEQDSQSAINQNTAWAQLCLGLGPIVNLSGASGAVNPTVSAAYVITHGSLAAFTLAAPVSGAPLINGQGVNSGGDDGTVLIFTSSTAYAHTITATGLFADGAGDVNLATFAAHAGASFGVVAYGGKWLVLFNNNITFS